MTKNDETSMPRGVRVTESPGTVIDMASLEKEKQGIKFDDEKTRFDLLPWHEIKQIADVLTMGAKKYYPDNWKYVEDRENRYFAAMMRHLVAWRNGEKKDGESHMSHLAHAACCILFLMFGDNQKEIK